MMTFDTAGFPVCAVAGGCSCAQPVITITASKSKTRVTAGSPKIRGDVRVFGLARADLIPGLQTFAKKKEFARAVPLPGRSLASRRRSGRELPPETSRQCAAHAANKYEEYEAAARHRPGCRAQVVVN
ncbi:MULTISPECIES: hypothetical protein [unclassified Paraburkholderia]|uniref:hypothetical protein n=1 Tax=unclassified Paraburkholderia TaxID=2615204 RepID=UPI002AB6F7BD|nr:MULTISPECIES: hypothetical protein [unclassified Paraburkholderia]